MEWHSKLNEFPIITVRPPTNEVIVGDRTDDVLPKIWKVKKKTVGFHGL
jgi:hypothetical protein